MNDRNDSDGGESFFVQLQDAVVEPEEEGEVNENESDHDEHSSDEDSRVVCNYESDNEDDYGSEWTEEAGSNSEKLEKIMLTFHEGNYDDAIEDALRRGGADHPLNTTHAGASIFMISPLIGWRGGMQ